MLETFHKKNNFYLKYKHLGCGNVKINFLSIFIFQDKTRNYNHESRLLIRNLVFLENKFCNPHLPLKYVTKFVSMTMIFKTNSFIKLKGLSKV